MSLSPPDMSLDEAFDLYLSGVLDLDSMLEFLGLDPRVVRMNLKEGTP